MDAISESRMRRVRRTLGPRSAPELGLYPLIRGQALRQPQTPFLQALDRVPLTFAQLKLEVDQVLNALHACGISCADTVTLLLPDGPEMAVAAIAVSAGAICAPLDPGLREYELQRHLATVAPKAVIATTEVAAHVSRLARSLGIRVVELVPDTQAPAGGFLLDVQVAEFGNVRPAAAEDVALALHTSGTSGDGKLVHLRHRNLLAAAGSICEATELSPQDRSLTVMPLYHIHGLSTLLASLVAGGSVICPGSFSVESFFESAARFGATWYSAAPALHRMILDHARRRPENAARVRFRFIRSASAPMSPELVDEMERTFRTHFIEAYGMTEAGPQIASNRLPPWPRKRGSVGTPCGPEVSIINSYGAELPRLAEGEIAIRGPNVIEAYATAAHQESFAGNWLRTGDLGYLDEDGYLFVTGRLKDVINRGGQKVSPREVDEALLGHPAVAEAVAFAVPHKVLGESIAAAVVLKPGFDGAANAEEFHRQLAQAIREDVAKRLSAFKVPQSLAILAELPTTPGGKTRRNEIATFVREMENRPRANNRQDRADSSSISRQLVEIWSEVLGIAPPRLDQNFFELGGHSLAAAQVASRVSALFQVDLPLEALFAAPTIAELRLRIERAKPARMIQIDAELQEASCTLSGGSFPASFAQRRLWFLDQLEHNNAYNMSASLWLEGELNERHLEDSLNEIRRRHAVLRSSFEHARGELVQVVAPAVPVPLEVVDFTSLAAPQREAAALRLAAAELAEPYVLELGPLFRAKLLRLSPDRHALVLGMHHTIADGWSRQVLFRELAAIMAGFDEPGAPALPGLRRQYFDYLASERDAVRRSLQQRQLEFWCDQLRDIPQQLALPTDRPRPAQQSHASATLRARIDDSTARALRQLALDEQTTPYMTLLAAFQVALFRFSRQRRFVVGTPVANRPDAEAEKLIGFFANTLPMPARLTPGIAFRELLQHVKQTSLLGFAHQQVQFERLVERLRPSRTLSRHPLFQVMFAFESSPADFVAFELTRKLRARRLETEKTATKFDLTLYVNEHAGEITTDWLYATDLFNKETIAAWQDCFTQTLEAIVQDPEVVVDELPVISRQSVAERSIAAVAVNGAAAPPPCFHRRFEEVAAECPLATAVEGAGGFRSYQQLNARANQLAHHLRQLGVARGTLVGVCLRRSADWIVAILGILKAGGAYLPIDAEYPENRVRWSLRDSGVRLVVADSQSAPVIRASDNGDATVSPEVVCMNEQAILNQPDGNLDVQSSADDLAYVIYTSGSTGRPKGVMITHGNIAHYLAAMRDVVGIERDDRYLHTASFAFSSSVRQFALPLSAGATVVIASHEQIRDPETLLACVRDKLVTIVDWVPSYLRSCVEVLRADARQNELLRGSRIRKVLSASEPLTGDIVHAWYAVLEQSAQIVNMFGQTETAGIVTAYPVECSVGAEAGVVPIGRPISAATVQILDEGGRPVAPGEVGEIYIGGATVGQGYLNQPELTAEYFLPDPNDPAGHSRLYRTRDLGRIRSGGIVEFVGRTDNQVKIRGHRIAPEEIEAVLGRHPEVERAAVVATARLVTDAAVPPPPKEALRGQRLVAFFVARQNPAEETQQLRRCEAIREYLRAHLPQYMVPAKVVEVERLPYNQNGKIDRSELVRIASDSRATPLSAGRRQSAEQILTAIWREVLRVEEVGLDDNFFDLGGDSILSVQAVLCGKQQGLAIDLKKIFQYQTIRTLAAQCEAGEQETPICPGDLEKSMHADVESEGHVRVSVDRLRAFGREALQQAGLSPVGAAIVTEAQLESSLRGQPTHNIGDIPRYCRRLQSGTLNPRPQFKLERETPHSVVIDGDNAPGQWVATFAMETAIRKSRECGFSFVAVRRSNHFGAAGNYVRTAAMEGLIGICTTNGPLVLAPTGGITPTFGNNPLAVGIPSQSHFPIILDMAMTVAPRGKIGLQLAEGRPLQPGWILDRQGSPTTDLADLAAGLSAPIGGHKGYGLALVMEVLAGVLSGAGFCWDHQKHGQVAKEAMDLGHLFIVVDPRMFLPPEEFETRVDRLIKQTKSGQRDAQAREILIPGELEHLARERNLRHGVPLQRITWRTLTAYVREAGLQHLDCLAPE